MLHWINRFSTCCFLDNHQYHFSHHSYECIAGAGTIDCIELTAGNALPQLQQFRQKNNGWLFGHLGYDLKNETEDLSSSNTDRIGFPDLFFFVPETVFLLTQQSLCILTTGSASARQIFDEVEKAVIPAAAQQLSPISFQQKLSRQTYIETVKQLQLHILRGDCYEINFCQEFFAEQAVIDPLAVYCSLSSISPAPFAAFYKHAGKYLLCASPERYLKKEGDNIISQPMKGTGKRDLLNPLQDAVNKETLMNSSKDRSENVMVVDLVRNDLSKICVEGSVQVEELFGIYSFPQVHQLVSTVNGVLQPGLEFSRIIAQTFPMGSMTGAPKRKVLELIEQYETTRRGIFSGAIGYLRPDGDFDFNVVIRSLLYNQADKYLSYLAGSGITFYSCAEAEYEECLLKAAAIRQLFS